MARTPKLRLDMDRRAIDRLAGTAEMERFVEGVAEDIAAEMERTAPPMVKTGRSRFFAETSKDADGVIGLAAVKSAVWHWAEYGTAGRHFRTPEPFIRPSAQRVISRHRGRFKPE